MKKINILLFSLLTLSGLMSCSDDPDLIIAPEESFVSPVLKAILPENEIFTENTDMNSNLGYVLWDKADYGYSAPVKYVLQADTAGGDFSKPIEIGSSSTNQLILTAKMLNSAGMNYTLKMKPVTLSMRLMTQITSIDFNAPVQKVLYSNIQDVTFTPYIAETPMKAAYYIVGAALVGWGNDPANIGADLQPFFSTNNNMKEKIYSYTGYFQANEIKLITMPGDWNTAGAFASSGASGDFNTKNEGGNYIFAAAGYYTFAVDFTTNKYTCTPYDASGATKFNTVGIIGDATPAGWGASTPMELVAGQEHLWVLKKVELIGGKVMKFRANDSWDDASKGGGNWGTGEIPFGKAENSGGSGNISIEKGGEYFIEFNDLTGEYIIMPLKTAQKK